MNKCLRITISGNFDQKLLRSFIQKHARDLKIEGTAHFMPDSRVRIIACGTKDAIDDFIDLLHKDSTAAPLEGIEIEPFLRDKDYRGVFRVIE